MRIMLAAVAATGAALLIAGTPAAHASTLATGTDWNGYAVTGSTYTRTTADWVMPKLACPSGSGSNYVAIWTGLDGYSSDTVEQVGAEAACAAGTAEYFGWYELYPGALVYINKTLKPGDQLDALVTYDGSNAFTLTLHDVTAGWDQSFKKVLAGAARSSAETIVTTPDTLSCSPTETLAAFTGDTVDGIALGSQNPVKITGTDPHIVVSPVNGEKFTVTCD
jgi:hypothetical protein